MIFGIISAVLLIFLGLRFVEKRLGKNKKRGVLSKLHFPASIAFIAASVLHGIFMLPFLGSRPLSTILTGLSVWICGLLSFYSGAKKKIKAHRLFALLACLFLILHAVFGLTGVITYQRQISGIAIENVDISKIPDGVYVGEYDATYIYAKVEVRIEAGKIVDIVILEHKNEHGKAAERVADDIRKQQSIDVDAVSGATNSSAVIKKAVENALSF